MFDVTKFVGELHEYIARAMGPVLERLKSVEDRAAAVPARGEKGEKGDPGERAPHPSVEDIAAVVAEHLRAFPPARGEKGEKGDQGASIKGDRGDDAPPVSTEAIAAAVAEYLAANPPARGEKGDPGASIKGDPGEPAAPISKEQIAAAVAEYLAANPPARGEKGDPGASVKGDPGARGDPGADAVINYDDIVKAVDEAHERLVAKYILDLERRGMDAIQRAIDKLPTPKDGRDGVGFEHLKAEYDGVRTITLKFSRDGMEKSFPFVLPVILDAGYYREGKAYETGDAVTHDGTLWIALKNTDVKPSITAKDDWRIGARKGRDGLNGKAGKDAPAAVQLNAR